jgi:pyruvate,water dikinase
VFAADPEFAEAFADYLTRFCFRAITYDVSDPLLAERPDLVLGLLRDQLTLAGRPAPEDRSGAIEEARTLLRDATPVERARFEERLAKALLAYPVREDNVYVTVCAPVALLRTAGRELGRRLVERGRLDDADDVFLLHVDEARSAALEGTAVRDLVERRRQDREHTLACPGPARYGPEAAQMPNVRRLPAAARETVEDLLWLLDKVTPALDQVAPGSGGDPCVISGLAAARGSARGSARIVKDETEFGKLRAGDVLVCECTAPAWSIVFPSLSAVVTNSGGILSHPAIVAREFGIPAVVATVDATSRLRDGQQVVVDGAAGTVRVVT